MPARRHVLALLAVLLPAAPVAAQDGDFPVARSAEQPPAFLILDQDRLFSGSRHGRQIIDRNEAEADALRAEGEQLDRQFEAEERTLTQRRSELEPNEFRRLADAFDEKVVATRREQEEKAAQLNQRIERRRREFFRRVGPVLLEILEQTGAVAIIEQRSVLIAKQDLNITDEAIKRLDTTFVGEQHQDPDAGDAATDTDPPGDEE
ncbi:OmpH family outer membrane protein [Rhodobacteraceae bacterium 2CG4]|uniref:OmpH family outer membrane protein n=1 Tax=Halovulum marinum TaxID=2662447 RepID=A0A6L5Z077_9RHOB|nr:OmpH family outer membrane protein [Halovulum marinum]MSU89927.1 OmpH family outer membrane protein [Halovulum marinum]